MGLVKTRRLAAMQKQQRAKAAMKPPVKKGGLCHRIYINPVVDRRWELRGNSGKTTLCIPTVKIYLYSIANTIPKMVYCCRDILQPDF